MSRNRSTAILVLAALACLPATIVSAQSYRIGDLQLFRPYDETSYGEQPTPTRGFFGSLTYTTFVVTRPDRAIIGAPISRNVFLTQGSTSTAPTVDNLRLVTQVPSLDSGYFSDKWQSGLRTEIGYITENGDGWQIGSLVVHGKSSFILADGPVINFNDPQNLISTFIPVIDPTNPQDLSNTVQVALSSQFDNVRAVYKTRLWTTDVQKTWRTDGGIFSGWLDWGLGVRYFAVGDKFGVTATGGPLDATTLGQTANNNILGPQFSLRWFNMSDRWLYSADLRLTPAANWQLVQQSSFIGSNVGAALTTPPVAGALPNPLTPQFLNPTGSNSTFRATEFSAIVDARFSVAYRLTDFINFRVGANAIYVDGVARSPSMVNWAVPNTSINGANNTQAIFMYGLDFGIEINR